MSQRRRSAFQALSKASASVSLDLAERQLRISKVLGQVRSQSQKREQEQVAFSIAAASKLANIAQRSGSGPVVSSAVKQEPRTVLREERSPMSAAIKSPPVVSLDASGGSSFRTSLAGKCAY